jgi:hypothetical protein
MTAFLQSFPLCSDNVLGQPCIIEESQGLIVYPQLRECAHSEILLPGFNLPGDLLPDWLLAGGTAVTNIQLCQNLYYGAHLSEMAALGSRKVSLSEVISLQASMALHLLGAFSSRNHL